MAVDDSELSSAVTSGDPKAEEELYLRFRPRVRRKLEGVFPGRPECEDLTNEILQAAIESLRGGRFRGECQLGTFIHAVAKNKIAEFLRRRRPQTSQLTQDIPDSAPAPDETVAREEVGRAIREALSQLRPKYRKVLYLYYYKGLRVREIAAAMGVSARQISEWKDYGLRVLRQRFGPSLIQFR